MNLVKDKVMAILGMDEEMYERVGIYCINCALETQGYKGGKYIQLEDNECLCPIAYNLQDKVTCVFDRYSGRQDIQKKLLSLIEEESYIASKIREGILRSVLLGEDLETAVKYATSKKSIKWYRDKFNR